MLNRKYTPMLFDSQGTLLLIFRAGFKTCSSQLRHVFSKIGTEFFKRHVGGFLT
jgi:hypothetical protein